MLPFTLKFYKKMFPSGTFIIIDNMSTDNTKKIAADFGCEIYPYHSNNMISDRMYQGIKNNIWKHAKTDWILICDCDELLCFNEEDLLKEEKLGTTAIRSECYNMVNLNNDLNIDAIDHGYRDPHVIIFYDKILAFNKKFITETNYNIGAHAFKPTGEIKYSDTKYLLRHYKYINPDYMVDRYALYKRRLSPENKANNWGGCYLETEETIRSQFESYRKMSKPLKLCI